MEGNTAALHFEAMTNTILLLLPQPSFIISTIPSVTIAGSLPSSVPKVVCRMKGSAWKCSESHAGGGGQQRTRQPPSEGSSREMALRRSENHANEALPSFHCRTVCAPNVTIAT